MSVFQRRQASSTYALMRSFERRHDRLDEAIELVRAGRAEEPERRQTRLGATPDFFETRAADEDADESGAGEGHEVFEDRALGGIVAPTLAQLREERLEVEGLLAHARRLAEDGEDSKFEKLRSVLRDPAFAREKFIVFTEHRDTAEFLVRRLEGLGFTGQVALIHGGLDYREREAQVDLFRRPLAEAGANYLVGTDTAGEGINLQMEPSLVVAGKVELVAHALVLPTADAEEQQRHDAQVEEIAMRIAQAHEEASGATVRDVSRPELARRAGLGDWPGFDLLSDTATADRRAIEVKGRARTGNIELSENEWAKACNLRDGYWLYAVYDCATPRPRLVRVRDPFGKLLVRSRELSACSMAAAEVYAAAHGAP